MIAVFFSALAVAAPIEHYTNCTIDKFSLGVLVKTESEGGIFLGGKSQSYDAFGRGSGACVVNPVRQSAPANSGELIPVDFTFQVPKGYHGCSAVLPDSRPPVSNLNGYFTFNDGKDQAVVPANVKIAHSVVPTVVIQLDSGQVASLVDYSLSSNKTGDPFCSDADLTYFTVRNLSGQFAQPDVVSATLYDNPVHGTPVDDPAYDADEKITEQEGNFINAMAELLPKLSVPRLLLAVGLATPAYEIVVRYRMRNGQIVTSSHAGVANIPALIPIPNGNNLNAPENVLIYAGTDPEVSGGYKMRIERVHKPALTSCQELPAEISINVPLVTGEDFGIGYQVLNLGMGVEGMPGSFEVAYDGSQDSRTDLAIRAGPGCSIRRPLKVIGGAASVQKRTNLNYSVLMAGAANQIKLAQVVNASGQKIISYSGSHAVQSISISGEREGSSQLFSLSNIPNEIEVCTHSGNACNVDGRKDLNSLASLQFSARQASGMYSPVTLNVMERAPSGQIIQHIDNLIFSRFAYDMRFDLSFSDFFRGSTWPKWLFLTTDNQQVSGAITNGDKSFISLSLRATNREIVARKRWYGFRLRRYGQISCNHFNLNFSNVPGEVEQWLRNRICG